MGPGSSSRTNTLVAALLVIVVLYLGQEVLIPFALALLLTFVLAPAVQRLQQLHVPRLPAVLITTVLSFALIGMIVWIIVTQTLVLAASLPGYKDNIETKLRAMGKNHGLGFENITGTIQELTNEVYKLLPPKLDERKLVPVEVVEPPDNIFQILSAALIPLVKPLGKAALVVVLVIFMLLKREDLKDRLFRLMGSGHLHMTMEALDEGGSRVSRYLLIQTLINGSLGIAVATGRFLIGLPHALLWGFLCAVLRFIFYLGSWVAAGLPIALSIAVFNNWIPTVLVIGAFLCPGINHSQSDRTLALWHSHRSFFFCIDCCHRFLDGIMGTCRTSAVNSSHSLCGGYRKVRPPVAVSQYSVGR